MNSPFEDGSGRFTAVLDDILVSQNVQRIARVAACGARELLKADGITFVIREDDLCHYFDEEAISPLWKGLRFPMKSCISGWVMEHHTPVIIPDIRLDERIPQDAYRPTFVRSLAMVPIRNHVVVGAIGAYWATEHVATRREIGMLVAISSTTAAVL